ncbi:MAG: hypothetical protein HPY85_06870 [Anaerolineae bacterium]|nr:hypothetical protein [Anaerolineae bacterium]
MRLEIPKIVEPLRLAEYNEAFGDAVVLVWVNPGKALLNAHDRHVVELQSKAEVLTGLLKNAKHNEEFIQKVLGEINSLNDGQMIVLAALWSQGPEETRWTVEEIRTLILETREDNPQLFPWLHRRTMEMIVAYRTAQKKGNGKHS